MAVSAVATASASLIPFLIFLPILSAGAAGASDAEALRRVISEAGLPRSRAALSYAADPCLTPGIFCEPRGHSLRASSISLPSRRLAGSISPLVGHLSDLREFSLPDNRISGPLPTELSLCINLEVLNLRNNRLSGEVPLELSALSSLRALDLSSNRFVGDIRFLVHFPNLENLSLAHNLFSGNVPLSIPSFPNLLSVDLSGNPDLIGDVPLTPHRLRLLPIRILAENGAPNPSSADSVAGPAAAPGPPASGSSSSQRNHRRRKHKIRNLIIGFLIGSLAGILSGLVASVLFHAVLNCIRGRYPNRGGSEIFSPIIKNREDLAFLKKNDGLADLEVIGRGGSGEVYRKELITPDGVKMIAIKMIRKVVENRGADPIAEEESRLLDKWMRQIRSEIRTIGRIRHRNLLPLVAHVSRPECHYLIYEYMKNGSLHGAIRDSAEGRLDLDWPARHRIAMGIAAGLEHLHVNNKPRIIHRDLKPANVLLNDNMEARIADFGFAKEVPDANTHMTMSNVAGTVGYISPEYYQTMKYTTKCDIYSFGVIIAVMVTGRFPSDEFFVETEELSMVKWMRNQVRNGNTTACFDGRIAGRGHDEQLELALKVACFCTADDPKQRPSSKDVRLMLAQIGSG